MSTDSNSSNKVFRPDIQGLRALAILLVLIYHADLDVLPGGYVGVDVFFVISGYLITGLLVREIECAGTVALAKFYARRIRRLLPAASLMLFATLVAAGLIYSPLELKQFASSAFTVATYVSNLWFAHLSTDYLAEDTTANPLLHTWSLSVEEQFYLVWPLILILVARSVSVDSIRKRALFALGTLSVVSLIASAMLTEYSQPWAFFSSPTRAWEFGAGGLVALHQPKSRTVGRGLTMAAGMFGMLLILYAGITFDEATRFPGGAALVPVLGTVLLIYAGQAQAAIGPSRWLSIRPMRFIGDISYSVYLWHWPIFVFLSLMVAEPSLSMRVAGMVASILIGWASYVLVENPFRYGRRKKQRVRLSIALGALLTASSAGFALAIRDISASGLSNETQQRYRSAANDTPIVGSNGCHANFFQVEIPECVFGDEHGDFSIVLFGDSHAAMWFPALEAIAREQGWRLIAMTKTGCASVHFDAIEKKLNRPYYECTQWRENAIKRIESLQPDLIVLANSSRHVLKDLSVSEAVRLRRWAESVRETLTLFHRIQIPVALIRDTPWLDFDAPVCLSRAHWKGVDPAESCRFDTADENAQDVFEIERAELLRFEANLVVDMTQAICPEEPCLAERDGFVLYHDKHHLSATFSRHLADRLYAQLKPALRAHAADH